MGRRNGCNVLFRMSGVHALTHSEELSVCGSPRDAAAPLQFRRCDSIRVGSLRMVFWQSRQVSVQRFSLLVRACTGMPVNLNPSGVGLRLLERPS